jgi:hypothetical protein
MRTLKTLLALGAAALVLQACGGGGGSPPVTEQVPGSVNESTGGFIDYLKRLVVAAADPLEPVDVSLVTPPTSESSEPETVD